MVSCVTYEKPNYRILNKFEDFEIRHYPSCLVAEVIVDEDFDKSGNEGFRILADFIFGNNKSRKEISMTAPVDQKIQEASASIKMTAPVDMHRSAKGFVVRFYMPSEYTQETLPVPVDKRILIRKSKEKILAARKYSGFWSESKYHEQKDILLKALITHKIDIVGEAIFARYNSPYTLWFLRHNEVLVEIIDNGFLPDTGGEK